MKLLDHNIDDLIGNHDLLDHGLTVDERHVIQMSIAPSPLSIKAGMNNHPQNLPCMAQRLSGSSEQHYLIDYFVYKILHDRIHDILFDLSDKIHSKLVIPFRVRHESIQKGLGDMLPVGFLRL